MTRPGGGSREHRHNTTADHPPRPPPSPGHEWQSVLYGQICGLGSKHDGERVCESKDGLGFARNCHLECSTEVVSISHLQPLAVNTKSFRPGLGVTPLWRDDRIARIHNHGNPCGARHGFLKNLESLLG